MYNSLSTKVIIIIWIYFAASRTCRINYYINKNILTRVFGLILCTFLLSCDEINDKDINANLLIKDNSPKLLYIEALQFDFIDSPLILGAFQARDSIYAFFNPLSNVIHLCNGDGSLISKIDRSGISPDDFGEYIGGLTFLQDSILLVNGSRGLFYYDFFGNLIMKHFHPQRNDGFSFITHPNYKLDLFNTNDLKGAIGVVGSNTEKQINHKEYYSRVLPLTIIKFNDQSHENVLPYPQESIYRNTNGYYTGPYPLYTVISDSTLVIVYPHEPIIYKYSLPDLKLESKFILPIKLNIAEPFQFDKPGELNDFFETTLKSDFFDRILPIDKNRVAIGLHKFREPGRNEGQATSFKFISHLIYIIDFQENKFFEIELPKESPYLSLILENTILLKEEYRYRDTEPSGESYMIYKLE